MRVFYYVHTGHRIGLDRFRRAAAIINCIKDEIDITLLTSDYRIASIAREFGIDNAVGIDVVRNIANIAQQGDKLIFDSEEANPLMLEDMRNYFSSFVRITEQPNDPQMPKEALISIYPQEGENVLEALIVDERYFGSFKKDIAMSFFFGDDDYEKDLQKHIECLKGYDLYLQLGFYYFLDYEAMLQKEFPNHFEFEEYEEMIKRSDILLTSSPQAVLESLASGGRPIYIQREDYTKNYIPLFESLGVAVLDRFEKEKCDKIIKSLSYERYKKIEKKCYKITNFLKKSLNL